MLTLLLVLLVVTPPQVGSVHILVESGDTIYMDGRQVGISSGAGGGLLLTDVPVGDHEIVVRAPSGGSATAKITVSFGMTTTVPISSLGLRIHARGNDSTVEVQVPAESMRCELVIGNDRVSAAPEELRMEHVRPGLHTIAVTCGEKHASAGVDIPAAKLVTLQADLANGKLHVVGRRDRVTAVLVPTPADKIMRLDLPFTWKRAIAASITNGVQPRSIEQKGGMRVEAKFSVQGFDDSPAEEFLSRLKERPEVETAYVSGSDSSRGGMTFTLSITFRGDR